MRWVVGLFFLVTPVAAAECEFLGSPEMLVVTDWRAEPGNPNVLTTIEYRSTADKPIVMIKASVWFFDKLGERVIGFQIDPDLKLAPGAVAEQNGRLIGDQAERLLKSDKSFFDAIACTQGVVYEDGTKEEFK